MFLNVKVSKNRKNTGKSSMFISPLPAILPSTYWIPSNKKRKYLAIDSYKQSKISHVFDNSYDSVPAVNTDSSIPISFDSVTCTFPNTRYSFFMYNSVAPMISYKVFYEDPYYNELESSPFPYGYEHEECFAKHTQTYGRGTSVVLHYKETDKIIKIVPRKIIIGYVKDVNTYIVKSEFLKEDDPAYLSYSFFKRNEKLLYVKKQHFCWNSPQELPEKFVNRIKLHLKNNNNLLHHAIEVAPSTVCQYRTVLNNQFWRKNSVTYLLNKSNKNARRRAQYAFKRNRVYDPLESYNLPKQLENVVRDSFVNLKDIPLILKIYNRLSPKTSEVFAAKTISDLLRLDKINTTISNLELVDNHLERLLAIKALSFKETDLQQFKILINLFSNYNNIDPLTCNSISSYLHKVSNVLRKSTSTSQSSVIKIGSKILTLNPSLTEVIETHIKTKFNYFSTHSLHSFAYPDAIFNGKPIPTIKSVSESLSFSELVSNADVLLANKIIDSKPKEVEEEVHVVEDLF